MTSSMLLLFGIGLLVEIVTLAACSNSESNPYPVERVRHGNVTVQIIKGFKRPFGVDIDQVGNLYVSDFGNNSVPIVRFDSEINFSGWLDGNSASGWTKDTKRVLANYFKGAHAIEITPAGDLVIADTYNHRLVNTRADGRLIGDIDDTAGIDLQTPVSAHVSDDGSMLVADAGAHRIFRLDKTGHLTGWLGATDTYDTNTGFHTQGAALKSAAPGGFDAPHWAGIGPSGNIIVVDTGNHRLQRFSVEGKFLGWIGARQDGGISDGWTQAGLSMASDQPGAFNAPTNAAFDPCGNIVVAEYGNPRIQLFSGDGHFLGWFGARADGGLADGWQMSGLAAKSDQAGGLSESYGVTFHDGRIIFSDSAAHRVEIVSLPHPACPAKNNE